MLKRYVLSLVCALLFSGASEARSETIYANDTNAVASAVQQLGYRALISVDNDGDPKISSSSDGINFTIYFYGCKKVACNAIQFSAGFDVKTPISLDTINSFNRTKLYGKTYLDGDGDPYINYSVNMDGGLFKSNFDDIFRTWTLLLNEFTDVINWR